MGSNHKKYNKSNNSSSEKKLSNKNIDDEEKELDKKIETKPSTNGSKTKTKNANSVIFGQNSLQKRSNDNKSYYKDSEDRNQGNASEVDNTAEKNQDEKERKSDHKFMVRHVWWIDALLFIGGTLLLGGLATLLGGEMFNFQNYKMPPATVPKIVFPIAWGIIYVAIGVSTFLMWRDKEISSKDRKINLIIYFVHMFFNALWPLWFFRLDLPIFACVWLVLTLASACVVMFRYFICNLPAGIIFNIYTLWLIYALYLNLGLVLINF